MHLDISRDTFEITAQVSRVLLQQGRLVVDADWNEQMAVFQHLLRALAADIIGWHGGPGVGHGPQGPTVGALAVKLMPGATKLNQIQFAAGTIGRYYVDGVLFVHHQDDAPLEIQSDPPAAQGGPAGPNLLVFAELWEREVTSQVDHRLADPALAGHDSAARAVVRCRVRARLTDHIASDNSLQQRADFLAIVDPARRPENKLPQLAARLAPSEIASAACDDRTSTSFRGPENQLYRVEIHRGGTSAGPPPTFKWSRDNGCTLLQIDRDDPQRGGEERELVLTQWWSDDRFGLERGDWIELLDADLQGLLDDQGAPLALAEVQSLDPQRRSVRIKGAAVDKLLQDARFLRRWDHRPARNHPLEQGAIVLERLGGLSDDHQFHAVDAAWITLEDGIQVQCALPTGGTFRPGDYWLIPARTASADILWPQKPMGDPDGAADVVAGVRARYTQRSYAPLALVAPGAAVGDPPQISDLRRTIDGVAVASVDLG